jgi:hypothetical protein
MMINTPTIRNVNCSTVAGRIGKPNVAGIARSPIGNM